MSQVCLTMLRLRSATHTTKNQKHFLADFMKVVAFALKSLDESPSSREADFCNVVTVALGSRYIKRLLPRHKPVLDSA
jgi:hypothetical protein